MKKTKEKSYVKSKGIKIKNIVSFIVCITILLYISFFYNKYIGKNNVLAKDNESVHEIKISNAEKIDIEKILEDNKEEERAEKFKSEEVELEYLTTYRDNNNLPKGEIQVVQEGRSGTQIITTKTTYIEDKEVSEEQVSAKVTKAAINKIVEIGTANYTSYYKVKIGDKLYVTSDRLSVMLDPSEEALKVTTLSRNDELKLLEITGSWYKVLSGTTVRIC